MAVAAVGGGSGAVGASSHAACERFRGTDPLITRVSRRALAVEVKFPDAGGGIPEARWMRAMTFERLVRDKRFASQVATTTVGQLALDRPTEVVIADAKGNLDRTAKVLADAHDRAVADGAATVIHNLAVPFVGFEDVASTDVKPDFVVVAAKAEGGGSWLIVGDAKDYERLRSRIEDTRLLKGFLQVAVGAESFAAWSKLPAGMSVHRWGALAVPRNAFLQPEAVVEDLHDHRTEIAMRIAERHDEAQVHAYDPDAAPTTLADFVAHLKATFNPVSCSTCTLFGYCRDELERSPDPTDLLVELGIAPDARSHVIGLVDGTGVIGKPPASVVATISATLTGKGVSTGQQRIDPVGLPGTIKVVIAKSDASGLGVHGIACQRVSAKGTAPWTYVHFDEPQSPSTRVSVMRLLGKEVSAAMAEARKANKGSPAPVHVVVSDKITADVLVSIADNLAGVELSRLRWQRDIDQRRQPLTFDGEPAVIPAALRDTERTAVSFLLEEDRARAVKLRAPIVDVRAVLVRHVVAGGPAVNAGRLDYLVEWADSQTPVDHRTFGKTIEQSPHTPGARLTNQTSNEIHRALTGDRSKGGAPNLVRYADLVKQELEYKTSVFDRAVAALTALPISNLRDAYRAIETDAQAVWRRRLTWHASDLVRFGRTYRTWRNSQVPMIESNATCAAQLLALSNPQSAHDAATEAGNREIAFASVVQVTPTIVLDLDSRRIGDGSRIVLLHLNDDPCVEGNAVTVDTTPKGAFKIDGLSIGPLAALKPGDPKFRFRFEWDPRVVPTLAVGDRLVVADFGWFSANKGDASLPVGKPKLDENLAPKDTCHASSYDNDPDEHQYCCKSHEANEAEWSDELASRRAKGQLNPQVWPPVRNEDGFEVTAKDSIEGDAFLEPSEPAPDSLTIDDLE